MVGFDPAGSRHRFPRVPLPRRGVVEAQHLPGPDGATECEEHSGAGPGVRSGRGPFDGGDVEGVDPVPQPGGHHLAQRGQRASRTLLHTCHREGGAPQGDDERDGLLVVEQQGRQLCAGVQPVAAVGALHRHHGVAELAEPLHVPPQGPRADLQPIRQHRAGPVPAGLEQ